MNHPFGDDTGFAALHDDQGDPGDIGSIDTRSGLAKAMSYSSPYGYRGRIGLIAPSTNTTMEPEFSLVLPSGVSLHTSRVHQSGGQEPASYRRMADHVGGAAAHLATAEVDLVTFGCSSCTYFVSPQEIAESITENAGCPAVLVLDAVIAAFGAFGAKRIGLVTPRTSFVTEREKAFLMARGLDVRRSTALGLGSDEEERRAIGRIPPNTLYRMAAEVAEDVDAVFITCTQLATLPVIDDLEARLGVPVISSNQATIWRCLRRIGVHDKITGYGSLLTHF
ncbi:aspartate/glutamate racemase family protein [Acuticoccus sp. M5D2P5]|uniref:maleate cis-trans isomerase family protein n=1 Tax=Acuticoccus kalidii TaxID=2910977 RepID=UPI001F43FBCA|nr:aspartate/glutamate racemase family protein [Acuticoccus kalidii]MCF3934777.1 aspartate/glutamate racemase family protein [Acuticoccus kalidii]